MSLDNLQRLLLYVGTAVAAFLLLRFAVDFTAEMSGLLAVPFWLLTIAALAVALSNIAGAGGGESRNPLPAGARAALLAMIPAGFFASSLDCTGLSLAGCSPYCGFVKTVWMPLVALACAAYYFKRSRPLLLAISAMIFVPLAPHCVCFNVGNGWWIERVGASPVCYVWGFTAGLISVSALRSGRLARPSLAVCSAIVAGATMFFVSHHYFHFPW
jgi:hypothetical protein